MAQRASRSETCNDNKNLDGSQQKPHCNQTDLFPFPGFTINNKSEVEDYTPVTKVPCGSILKCSNSTKSTEESSSSATTKPPPVEPSVSPEIQSSLFRSVLVSGAAPSTCYGAGHVISGVNDRRKCKARGILSAGHSTPLQQGFPKDNNNNLFSYCKSGQDTFKESSPSIVPFPTEASISWHLSPTCVHDNDDVVGKGELSSISPCDTVHHTPQEERILSSDFNGECSPFSADFLSSGNVMQTPNSDSSLEGVQLKYKFESDLDQLTDVLEHESLSSKDDLSPWDPPRLSSEFTDLSPPSNRANLDTHASWVSNSTSEYISESQIRISWRDEVISGAFDKDDLDCCRLLSDEEIDADGLIKSPKLVRADGKDKETSFPTRINPCEESICTDDGGLNTSADSDWTLHYKNQSLEL